MKTSIVYDRLFLNHITNSCPENPERYEAILSTLEKDTSLWDNFTKKNPKTATLEDILRCHDKKLVDEIKSLCQQGGGNIDADTVICPASYEIAKLAAFAAKGNVQIQPHRNRAIRLGCECRADFRDLIAIPQRERRVV